MSGPARTTTAPLLEIAELAISFEGANGEREAAVEGLSLTVHSGQTVALVGESGCGKSVTALSLLGLLPPAGRVDRGSILFDGRDLLRATRRERRAVRGSEIAMIFQEPMQSLNPVLTVGDQLVEAIRLHRRVSRRVALELAERALRDVGIEDPRVRLRAHPHELSGGLCQRVMIAMALAGRPRLLLADEPTTALDVTIQHQILALLGQLQTQRSMSMLLITHDLGVVAQVADVVCVMFGGRLVECASVFGLFDTPHHPYTRGLFGAIPRVARRRSRLATVDDVVGDPAEFGRLPGASAGLVPWWPAMEPPPGSDGAGSALVEIAPGHWVRCWATPTVLARAGRSPDLSYRRRDGAPAA